MEDQQEKQFVPDLSYGEQLLYCTSISKPMASEKLAHKIHKLIKKGSKKNRTHLFVGNKAVQGRLKKGDTGLVVIAGDVEPVDIVCHFAGICEEKGIPYIYTPSKSGLGSAFCGKGQAMICLIKDHKDFSELYQKVLSGVQKAATNL